MPFGSATTRMPAGVTNAAAWQTMGNAGAPDPTYYHQYANDFDTYAAGDWTVSLVGTGTQALQAGYDGGGLALVTTAGAADADYMQLVQAGFKLVAGKEVFFKWAGQIQTDLNEFFYAGLIAKTATPLAGNPDGLFLRKSPGGTVQLIGATGGVTTVLADTGFTPTLATDFEIGFHVDVQGNVEVFYNPTTGNNPISAAAGVPRGRVAAAYGPSLPASVLTPSFGLLNNSAVARTLITDYIVAARAR